MHASKLIAAAAALGVGLCLGSVGGLADTFTGSGFAISDSGSLVTNAHVVEGCTEVEVPGYGTASVITADKKRDLAVVQISGKTYPSTAVRIDTGKLDLGEAVVALGYPLSSLMGNALSVSSGVVSSLSGIGGDQSTFTVSANVQPGNSGGPILNMRGEVVGVAQAKLDEAKLLSAAGTTGGTLGFAISAQTLANFLLPFKSSVSDNEAGDTLSVEGVTNQARLFVVQIVCKTASVTATAAQRNAAPIATVDQSGPSFDCAKATKADEKAICGDETLARLDRATTEAFNQARRRNKQVAIATARAFLALRAACNYDVSCIQKLQYNAVAAFAAVRDNSP
jgi:S1-C subfamily serine protease